MNTITIATKDRHLFVETHLCASPFFFVIFMFDNIIQLFFLVECLHFLNP